MARVTVRRDDYEDGVLPPVCVLSGERAEVLVEHRSRAGAPAWALLLLLAGPLGVLAILVVEWVLRVEASGLVPMSRAEHAARREARRRWNVVAVAGGAVAVGGLGSALVLPELVALVAGIGVAGLAVAAVGWFAPLVRGVSGQPDRTGRSVELRNVSSAFAAAYRAQDEVRAEARRRAVVGSTAPVATAPGAALLDRV